MLEKLKAAWAYLMTFDPTMLRALAISLFTVLATVGYQVANDTQEQILNIVAGAIVIISVIQGLWTRRAVVPKQVHEAAVTQALYTPVPVSPTDVNVVAPEPVPLEVAPEPDYEGGGDSEYQA